MPWNCRLIHTPASVEDWAAIRVGDMWYEDDVADPRLLAAYVAEKHAGKRPVTVKLPGPVCFPIYSPPTDGGPAWDVEGVPPAITIRPSINCYGVYHGYVTGGVVADDIEGRRYNDDGVLIRDGK